jgi:hypothetical protein
MKKLLLYVEMFWMVFASIGFGMMFMTMLLADIIPTTLDLWLFVALILRVGISIWWIDDIVNEEVLKEKMIKIPDKLEVNGKVFYKKKYRKDENKEQGVKTCHH